MNFRVLLSSIAYVLAGVAIGITAMQWSWLDWLYAHLHYLLAATILGALALALLGALAYLALKWWIRHKLDIQGDLTGEQVVIGLADKLTNRDDMDAPTAQDRMHSLMVNMGLYYVRSVAMQRYFLVIGGTFTALIGMATVFLLNEQNKKLDVQTEQIRLQSQANTVASLLMEGTRRAALSAEQAALFADIRAEATAIRANDEGKSNRACEKVNENAPLFARAFSAQFRSCWREVELPFDGKIELVHLSNDLIQRVRAYALRATPYPIAMRKAEKTEPIDINKKLDEQFEFPELSPERGQLLQTLALNWIDAGAIEFASADLKGIDLSRAYLRGVNLSGVNLRGANLVGVDVSGADLRRADLTMVILRRAGLNGVQLRGANLHLADLTRTNLSDIGCLPRTNEGRRQALDGWVRSLLAPARGLDYADLPKGFAASCSSKSADPIFSRVCNAEGGWTITYVDQPEFEPKVDGPPANN